MSPHETYAFASAKILHPQFKWTRSVITPQLSQNINLLHALQLDFISFYYL
jgi:hypothetical protein